MTVRIIRNIWFKFLFILFRRQTSKILPNVLAAIGNTPMIKLNKIPDAAGLKCNVCKFILDLLRVISNYIPKHG